MMMMNEKPRISTKEISTTDNYKPKILEDLISVTSTDIINHKDLSDIKEQLFKSEFNKLLKNENKTSLLDKEKMCLKNETIIQTFDKKYRKYIKIHKNHFELLTMIAKEYNNLEYHECISVNTSFIFHIDMDSDNRNLISFVPTIINILEEITNKKLKYIITGSENFHNKFHLIVPNLVCENGNAYYQIMFKLTLALPEGIIEDNRWSSFQMKPDKSDKFVNLRMVCSNKYSETNTINFGISSIIHTFALP